MSDFGPFGDTSRYYSGRALGRLGAATLVPGLYDLLGKADRDRVQQTCKGLNEAVRRYVRSETALDPTSDETRLKVTIEVVDTIPDPVQKWLKGVEHPMLWRFILNRRLLKETESGLAFLQENYGQVADVVGPERAATMDEIRKVHRLVEQLRGKLKGYNPVRRILQSDQDVLGAYWFREGRIELYWVVIALVAAGEGMDIGDLTTVVLAHELAHAYTHLGFDIDGHQWDTETMARTDTRIVEGLAQFYARVVCERLSARHPGALLAYRQLLSLQGGAYVVHKDWVKEDESGGEVVRSALVECRRRGILTYDGFQGLLTQRREGMGVTRKTVERRARRAEEPGLFGAGGETD